MGTIEELPRTLTWEDHTLSVVVEARDAFFAELVSRLGACIGAEGPASPLGRAVEEATERELYRVLTAPETTYRLLWAPTGTHATSRFVAHSLQLEAFATRGSEIIPDSPLWSALGDFCVDHLSGEINRWPALSGLPPLDFGSAHARSIDIGGDAVFSATPNQALADVEIRTILPTLNAASAILSESCPVAVRFVNLATQVIVFQNPLDRNERFSSGSTWQHLGRTTIGNASIADAPRLADALVHEAIHHVIYMDEWRMRWALDHRISTPTRCVRSPWTGNILAPRPFLQACFVWYGLAHLWCSALRSRATPNRSPAQYLFWRAMNGFRQGPLVDALGDLRTSVEPRVISTVCELQRRILAAF